MVNRTGMEMFNTVPNQFTGRVGAFASGTYWCNCSTCEQQFQADKRSTQCLTCTLVALVRMNTELRSLLNEHHQHAGDPDLELKLGDDYFSAGSCYVDSTLEESTTLALLESVPVLNVGRSFPTTTKYHLDDTAFYPKPDK